MITDKYLEKNGKKIRKAVLLYIDGELFACDGCDEKRKCAVIQTIGGDIIRLCDCCLNDILKQFD
jgi:hypothetical protein